MYDYTLPLIFTNFAFVQLTTDGFACSHFTNNSFIKGFFMGGTELFRIHLVTNDDLMFSANQILFFSVFILNLLLRALVVTSNENN